MPTNLIGSDIELLRKRYDEALMLRGIPAKYQNPLMATSNAQGEPVVEAYSEYIDTHIFFDGNPKIKTFKRYGWVVENDANLPFLIHCSFNLPNMQRDCLFTLSGQYSGLPDRVFRVIEITMDLQAPDHLIAQVVPVYDTQTVGRTEVEIKNTFNTSNHFLNPNTDYRGHIYSPSEEKT